MSIFTEPENTRLITIVAHVDHGKTTLADVLITANGIINERLAGSLRYLDSTTEEQRRGITMHASAIGLTYNYTQKKESTKHIIHLIDSPGHQDFCQEVTASLAACDGALVLVDSVEGMGARLHAVLRETYAAKLVPILVINKIDRLCTELHLTKSEAYMRLRSLLENVNAACASIILSATQEEEIIDEKKRIVNNNIEKEKLDEHFNFEPVKNNVVFASALHNWGFTIQSLAISLFKSKVLPFKPMACKQFLWGDYKHNPENHKITAWRQKDMTVHDPMFAEYGLGPIWDLYGSIEEYSSFVKSSSSPQELTEYSPGIGTILTSLRCGPIADKVENTTIDSFESLKKIFKNYGGSSVSGSFNDEGVLRALLRRFRSLYTVVLDSVCEIHPSPIESNKRVCQISKCSKHLSLDQDISAAITKCDNSPTESPTVAQISKFMPFERRALSDGAISRDESDEEHKVAQTVLVGLGRVLSGVLHSKTEYNIIVEKSLMNGEIKVEVTKRRIQLYLLMGSSLIAVSSIPAGHICGITNVDDLQSRTLTISSSPTMLPLSSFQSNDKPLVRVNVEAVKPSDNSILEQGLIRLRLADASVEVTATAKGERILAALGELHLEQALLDLVNVYCDKPIELRSSDPLVEFGEGTDWFEWERSANREACCKYWKAEAPLRQASLPPYCYEEGMNNALNGRSRAVLPGKSAAIYLRILPLHENIHSMVMQSCVQTLSHQEEYAEDLINIGLMLGIIESPADEMSKEKVLKVLREKIVASNSENIMIDLTRSSTVLPIVNEFGQVEEPIFIDNEASDKSTQMREFIAELFGKNIDQKDMMLAEADSLSIQDEVYRAWKSSVKGSAAAGFLSALRSGPLCEEHIRGLLVVLEGAEIGVSEKAVDEIKPLSGGLVVAALREGIRCALLTRPCRIWVGYFKLTLHSSLDGLGPLYSVLTRRRGRVISDEMVDGTDLILITAVVPTVEAFGLTQELLRTSGGAVTTPEMQFSHWEPLEDNPFWVPTTLEEREEFGELLEGVATAGVLGKHRALTYLRNTRKRKGLLVDESKLVKDGEKQRTLARKR